MQNWYRLQQLKVTTKSINYIWLQFFNNMCKFIRMYRNLPRVFYLQLQSAST